MAIFVNEDILERDHAISAPTLVIHDQRDPMAPPTGLPPTPSPAPEPKPAHVESIDDELSRYNPDAEAPWTLPEEMLVSLSTAAYSSSSRK